MAAGYIWIDSTSGLFHYTDSSSVVRVIAGGLTCGVDCALHDSAEDADVNVTAESSNNDGACILNQTTNQNLEDADDKTGPYNAYDYGSQLSGVLSGQNGGYLSSQCNDNCGGYCPGAQGTYWLVV